jgi:CrcB protein
MPSFDRRELAAVFVGGALGGLLRTTISRWLAAGPGQWPWAVFAINVTGAFILGHVVTRLQERLPLSTYRRPLLGTGFCGAYTTFSTMQLELLDMLREHRDGLALGYATASIVAGLIAIFAATALTRGIRTFR